MHVRRTLLFLVFLVAASLPFSAMAATYNPFTDFSLASNPNGVWSYGYGTVGSGGVTLYTQKSGQSWEYQGIPLIGSFNGTISTATIPAGDLQMHPGNAEALATILVFTAPTTGVYSLSGLFERDDVTNGGGNGVQVSICKNTVNCTLFSSFISSSNYLNNAAFNLSSTLVAGETLDFEVARTGSSFNFDTTGLQLNITDGMTPTPEPSSFALLGTGMAAICGAASRRLRKRSSSI